MSIYDRPMFRRKMGGATGIMASGPELIRRANGGGLNIISSAQGTPLFGTIPKPVITNRIFPAVDTSNTVGMRDPGSFTKIEDELMKASQITPIKIKTEQEKEQEKKENIEQADKMFPESKINQTNKKILESKDEETGDPQYQQLQNQVARYLQGAERQIEGLRKMIDRKQNLANRDTFSV